MKVYVSGFWPNFLDLEMNESFNIKWFIKLLNDIYNEEIIYTNNLDEADILLNSIFATEQSYYYLNYKEWKASFLFTGESCHFWGNQEAYNDIKYLPSYTCILGYNPTNDNFIEFPFYLLYMKMSDNISYEPTKCINNNDVSVVISQYKPQRCLYFLDKLEKKMNILYGGTYKNNIGGRITPMCGGYSENLINFYKKTKFVITMENTKIEHYITEKLINGFRAGIVPIYWGSPHISKHFNPKRFIVLEDDSESAMDAVIDRMENMSDEEYFKMVNEPIFNEGMNIDIVYNNAVNNIKKLVFKK
jgi:hypothetical protein